MKNKINQKVEIKVFFALALVLILSSGAYSELFAEIDTKGDGFSQGDIVTFEATIDLTECEQLDDADLYIDGNRCSLPVKMGTYPENGNCKLNVTITETNPSNCYSSGGSNTMEYEIEWMIPLNFPTGTHAAAIEVEDKQGLTASDYTSFYIQCTTTTTKATTTTTCATTTTTCATTTTRCPTTTLAPTTTSPSTTCPSTTSPSTTSSTTTPSSTTTTLEEGCHMYYWFNDDIRECNYGKFCGSFMYLGLRTFETLEECEEELNNETNATTTTTSIATTTTIKKSSKSNTGGDGSYPNRPARIISSCFDMIKNYGETDVDCGGTCEPCKEGKRCEKNSDCVTNYCYQGICVEESCSDGIMNQDESDIDCGGSCDKCSNGRKCKIDGDCKSDYCDDGICRDKKVVPACPTVENCADGIFNLDESDIDCGGSCRRCEEGRTCNVDSDCLSYYCLNNTCVMPTCEDGIQNQGEDGTDCGGPCKECAKPGAIGFLTAVSGNIGNILMLIIILLLLAILIMQLTKKRKYVASSDYLQSLEQEEEFDSFINKKKPAIVAGTSRKIRKLKKYLDEGKVDIIWVKDWDYVNELVSKGLDDNNAESLALAKQLKAGLFTTNEQAKKIADEEGVKAYDKE